MTLKLLTFGDLHLKPTDPFGTVTEGVNSRLLDKLDKLDAIREIAKEHGCSYVVELGDTFDHVNPPDYIRTLYAKKVRSILEQRIGYIRILGNHETTGHEYGGAGMDTAVLAGSPMYRVVNKPEVFSIQWKQGLKEVNLLLIPEVSHEEILDAIKNHPDLPILGHFGVAGAVYPNGEAEKDGVPQVHLLNRDIYLGHIHSRQSLMGGRVNYIGAVARANFGDKDVPTGCCIVSLSPDGEGVYCFHEFVSIPDVELAEFVVTPDLNPITAHTKIHEKGFIAKIKYEGPKEWFMAHSKQEDKEILERFGAAKVFSQFTQSGKVEVVLAEGTNSIKELIIAKANADGQAYGPGLKILEMVVNEQSVD